MKEWQRLYTPSTFLSGHPFKIKRKEDFSYYPLPPKQKMSFCLTGFVHDSPYKYEQCLLFIKGLHYLVPS